MKFVIVVWDKKSYNFDRLTSECVLVYSLYKRPYSNLFSKIIRKVLHFIGIVKINPYYDDWKKYLKKDNFQIVFFDACQVEHGFLRTVSAKSSITPILYYWNPILNSKLLIRQKKRMRVYTYSKNDSIIYSISFNQTFFLPFNVTNIDEKYDAVFIGKNKGRLELLEKIYACFCNPYFYVIKDDDEKSLVIDLKEKKDLLTYDEYISIENCCEAIVEILPTKNAGYTLRTLEAVLLQKKLITNNLEMYKSLLYKYGNILIIDSTIDMNQVYQFMNKPFNHYDKPILDEFSFEKWCDVFLCDSDKTR